jgi:hypothetical protein
MPPASPSGNARNPADPTVAEPLDGHDLGACLPGAEGGGVGHGAKGLRRRDAPAEARTDRFQLPPPVPGHPLGVNRGQDGPHELAVPAEGGIVRVDLDLGEQRGHLTVSSAFSSSCWRR